MMELRKTGGNGVIAEKCVPKIEHADSAHVIIDGLRSLREVDVFKAHFPKFTLIAVYASPQTRFKRLNYRRRSDDSNEWAVFRERDLRELSVGLGSAIALAEYLVVNEKLKKETSKQVQEILRRVERKWMK